MNGISGTRNLKYPLLAFTRKEKKKNKWTSPEITDQYKILTPPPPQKKKTILTSLIWATEIRPMNWSSEVL